MESPPPFLLAALLCDSVITDQGTKKKTLVGIFDRITCPELPAVVRLGFFARMTDAEGAYRFTVNVIHLETNNMVGMVETPELVVKDRLGAIDIALNLPPVAFPQTGRYEFQIFANDVYIGRTTVSVVTFGG